MKNTIVHILGAGCSANYGYPLAKEFRDALREYGVTLEGKPNFERLKECVIGTVDLMQQYQSPTVDRLVLRIGEEFERQRRPLGHSVTDRHTELETAEQKQILDAKIATTAFLLDREIQARKTGLQGYRDFLNILFEGARDPRVLRTTAHRVLSFNYDRLFEIAFADYFKLDSNLDYYAQAWLNSGLDFLDKKSVDVAPARFCFLKLHGTAGIFVGRRHGFCRYGCMAFYDLDGVVNDSLFWPAARNPTTIPGEIPEPLIVFPFEKDRARSGGTSFVFDEYVRTIWGEREKPGHAEKLIREAKQIRIIGYSFDPNDRSALIQLLVKSTDSPIIIRNRTLEEARNICEELGLDYPDLTPRLKPFAKPF